jgi:hypothetical protein
MQNTVNHDRLACRKCTKLKVKCDKQVPCTRCTRTGHECLPRETPARRKRRVVPSQVPRETLSNQESPDDTTSAHAAGAPRPAAIRTSLPASVLTLLEDTSLGETLVKFHVRHLAWYHNVLHSPTFLNECEAFWSGQDLKQPLWLALYLAILSSSAWTIENSVVLGEPLCLDGTALAGMASRCYQGMVDVLYALDFTANHSVYSVQAVLVSTMVAHCLGRTEQLYTMMFSCTRISQCLGLHHIKKSEGTSSCIDQWSDTVASELGKRVCWKLVECDYYAIPYTSTYGNFSTRKRHGTIIDFMNSGTNIKHITTPMPSNCDDHDLEGRDSSALTVSSYTNVMIKSKQSKPRHQRLQLLLKLG